MNKNVVLDTSALLAWRDTENGSDIVEAVLDTAIINTVILGELHYKLAEFGDDPAAFEEDIRALGVRVTDFTAAEAALFPLLKERDAAARQKQREAGTPARTTSRLSLGDICCLATAIHYKAEVITGDMYWTEIDLPISVTVYRK